MTCPHSVVLTLTGILVCCSGCGLLAYTALSREQRAVASIPKTAVMGLLNHTYMDCLIQ